MGIWLHNHTITSTDVSKDSGQLAEILGDVSVQTMPLHYSYSWGCRTFQTASHIHILHKCCLRTFICCGWAYSCTLTPLPPQMFQRLVTMFCWKPRWCKCVNHGTIMVETVELTNCIPYPYPTYSRCLSTFICCGLAYTYGCTSTPPPPQMFQRFRRVVWNPK